MLSEQRAFLLREVSTLSIVAAFATRSRKHPIYGSSCSEQQREEVKTFVRGKLEGIATTYTSSRMSEQDHFRTLESFADEATDSTGPLLHEGHLRFGVTQKLVNLYLKYLWVTGLTEEPWHCPIDGIVRDAAKLDFDWTSSNSRDQYQSAISQLRVHARPLSIAVWELKAFELGRK